MAISSWDFEIGSQGDNHYIVWYNSKQFRLWRGEPQALFACYGRMKPDLMPKAGDTLFCKFTKSEMLFRFEKVTISPEQDDVFFAEVRPIKQELNEGEDGNATRLLLPGRDF
jgi:hypothetical protein